MLNEDEKNIISRFINEGWSHQEIAQTILAIRNAAIFKSLQKEIKKYQDILEKPEVPYEK